MTTRPFRPVAAVTPRAASTTLIVRDGDTGLEVLMVRRSAQASFMPGSYVFPGGAVDAADGAADCLACCDETAAALTARIGGVTAVADRAPAYAVAALRECFEECGLWLGGPSAPATPWALLRRRLAAGEPLAALAAAAGARLATRALQPWSHWVTPIGLPKRFDTLFFIAAAPADQLPEVDAGETTTLAWVHPPAALSAHGRGEFPMEFATVQTLRSLEPFALRESTALIAHATKGTHLPPLHPRLRLDAEGQVCGVLLPGQAGYDAAFNG